MADYNTYSSMPPQFEGTKLVPRSGIMERTASNGAGRPRALQSATKYDPVINITFMTQTQRNALVAFYTANRAATFTFTADEDGVQRTCYFAPVPYSIEPLGGKLYKGVVYLKEA